MKKIILGESITEFIKEIEQELNLGSDVEIVMHGYSAIVYKGSSIDVVKSDIIKKLRTIQKKEAYIELLKRHSDLTMKEIDTLVLASSPDDLADLCLELGIIGTEKEKKI